MPQADGLVRHDAKHNPSSSLQESCFCTPLDHILHEAGIYLGSGAGLSSKFHSEEMSRQKEKYLLGEKSHRLVQQNCLAGFIVTVTHVNMSIGISSSAVLKQ